MTSKEIVEDYVEWANLRIGDGLAEASHCMTYGSFMMWCEYNHKGETKKEREQAFEYLCRNAHIKDPNCPVPEYDGCGDYESWLITNNID